MNISKLENPERLKELNPTETLSKVGFKNSQILCDIGAGSGIFTIPAAKISSSNIYALDISPDMLKLISEKANKEGLDNIKTVLVDEDDYKIEDGVVDHVIMVTAFHHIDNKDFLLSQIRRILKPGGVVSIIEFHKKETPMGPPVDHRIDEQEVKDYLEKSGFKTKEHYVLGANFYVITFSL